MNMTLPSVPTLNETLNIFRGNSELDDAWVTFEPEYGLKPTPVETDLTAIRAYRRERCACRGQIDRTNIIPPSSLEPLAGASTFAPALQDVMKPVPLFEAA